ncbi:Tcomplex protein 1, theta subunit [Pelomyxa schiedti]|nr:Tcomplex protein 1, theta subunit [Pelomyxa schiedti]
MVDLLKEGSKHFSGLEEAILRNCDAVKKLSQIVRTSLGPNGLNKMVINHLEKLFVTSDAATIIKELEVVHPAAKMVVIAAQQQETEVGDCTNLVVSFAGELMTQAENLLRMGLHPSQIVEGYSRAGRKALELMEELTAHKVVNLADPVEVARCLRATIQAKQYGYHDVICPLIARACVNILPRDPTQFNVDNVRVAKILGGGVSDSMIVRGFVITREVEGTIKHVNAAKIAVFSGGFDIPKPETKGTVLIENAEQLLNYSRSEEEILEQAVKDLVAAGVNVVVSGSSVGELSLHYLERYRIMLVKVLSRFDLRRLCLAVHATPLISLGVPTPDKLGTCDVVTQEEIGSTMCTIFRQEADTSKLATLIVRASTQNVLDDIERAVDDGVSVFKQMTKDGRFVAGAGACETELAIRISSWGETQPGLDQYAIKKFAEAFEVVPRTLSENSGLNQTETVSKLYAAHQSGKPHAGVDIEGNNGGILPNSVEEGVLDHLGSKRQAIELATNAAVTILRVDQIIMQKQAGGPKPPKQGGAMDAGDDY